MKRFLLCCSCFFAIAALHSQDGPFSGNSATTAPIPGSSNSWINPNNAFGSDNSYTTFGNITAVGAYTDYLVITDFLFTLPPGASISGIVVDIERSDIFRRTADYSIRIVKNGVIGTSDRSSGAGYRAGDSYQSYGSSGDLWGETWTDADINNPGFGVAIAAQRSVGGAGTTAGKIDDVQITVFYNFVITPVRLISFSAGKKNKQAELTWTTADEVNMDHYEIERSSNGRDFTTIGTVSSQNQPSRFTYTYFDKSPLSGISYYRLKMTGTAPTDIGYSKIVSIDFNNDSRTILYPNPLRYGGDLIINNSSGQRMKLQFYNISGQMVADVITTSTHVPASALFTQRGILPYKIYDKNGKLSATGMLLIE